MERKNKETATSVSGRKTPNNGIVLWVFGFFLTMVLKLYFLVPDLISSIKKNVFKKPIAAQKMKMKRAGEERAAMHEIKNLQNSISE